MQALTSTQMLRVNRPNLKIFSLPTFPDWQNSMIFRGVFSFFQVIQVEWDWSWCVECTQITFLTSDRKTQHKTRMHSSTMRTGRTLTVFWGRTPPLRKFGGPPPKTDTPPENLEEPPPPKIWRNPPKRHPPQNLEEAPPKKTPPPKFGGTPQKKTPCPPAPPPKIWRTPPPDRHPPPVNRITDTCKNITLAKTSFRPVMMNGAFTVTSTFTSCVHFRDYVWLIGTDVRSENCTIIQCWKKNVAVVKYELQMTGSRWTEFSWQHDGMLWAQVSRTHDDTELTSRGPMKTRYDLASHGTMMSLV